MVYLTNNMGSEFHMIKRAMSNLREAGLHVGSTFTPQRRSAWGYEPIELATLKALERREVITLVRTELYWSDGTEINPRNLHAGKIVEKKIYRINFDNFNDWFEYFASKIIA